MRLGLLGDQFENGFVIEPALLRSFQPGSAQWPQSPQIVGSDRVIGERLRVEQQMASGGCVQGASDGQVFPLLKGNQRQPGPRARDAIQGTRRNTLSSQRQLNFEGIQRRPREMVCVNGNLWWRRA